MVGCILDYELVLAQLISFTVYSIEHNLFATPTDPQLKIRKKKKNGYIT